MAALAQKHVSSKLRQGERLGGKYALVRQLAVGGMGQIWLAKNEMTDAQVALKVLRPDAAPPTHAVGKDADLRRAHHLEVEPRFRHEAKLGAMLSHRNIVRVFDFIEEPDGSLVLVMELLRGDTLSDFILERGKLSAVEAIALLMPILSALEHAHEVGVVHRDLKPANIMLAVDPDGHVTPKLLDFGIAKVPVGGVHTLEGGVLGTPRYMSPEQIRHDAKIDGRSDLFTVGILLYEMLTGVSPFEAGSPSASLAAVLEMPVDPDPEIDPRVWFVIQRALAKRPYERFATAGELAKNLRAAVAATDKELADTLQRAKPAPRSATLEIDNPSSQVIDARSIRSSVRPVSEDGAALEVSGLGSPQQTLRRVIAAAVLLSIIAVLGTVSVMRRSSSAAATPSEPTAPTATATVAATPTGTTLELDLPAVPPTSTVPTFVTANPVRHRQPPAITTAKKRQVATTPGF